MLDSDPVCVTDVGSGVEKSKSWGVYRKRTIMSTLSSTVKIACGQLCSSSSLPNNARIIKKLIRKAVHEKVKVLFLPEASDYISRDANHSVQLASSTHTSFLSTIQQELKDVYTESSGSEDDRGLFVSIGIHEPSEHPGPDGRQRVRNDLLWIDNRGEIVYTYQKLHLFDINIANGPILKESNSVEPGNTVLSPFGINSSNLKQFQVGFSICYDIRFPELGLRLRKLGANILTYPSAFTTKTGESHWVELGKARAIDTQCYVVMAAQCGPHDVYADTTENAPENAKQRVSYGQSIIISPWGDKLAECSKYTDDRSSYIDPEGDYFELCVADLDLSLIESTRKNMPLLDHRRPDVFGYEI